MSAPDPAAPIRVAVVGLGKIARDQHLPAIAADPAFALAATVSRSGDGVDGVPHVADLDALVAADIGVDAVALCTPPQPRRALAAAAAARGWHLFLEKPPGATLSEVAILEAQAAAAGVSVFASWHSRFAAGVEPARRWLASRAVTRIGVSWREDVRVWHPGQPWIWEPGGFGVFDPGINALSILTRILPRPVFIADAELDVPGNCAAPIAVRARGADAGDAPLTLDFDFRQEGPQSWDVVVETADGTLTLSQGGAVLALDGRPVPPDEADPHGEYPGLYRRFAELVRTGASEVDTAPLRLVADCFLRGRVNRVEDFHD